MAPVDVQVYQFFVMVLTGMAVGVVYDLHRTLRRMSRAGPIAVAIYDALFWVMATVMVLVAVFYASWGEVRVYVFIGVTLGGLAYFRLASPLVLRVLRAVWALLAKVCGLIALVIHYVVVMPMRFVVRVAARVCVTLSMPFVGLHKLMRYGLRYISERLRRPPEVPPEFPPQS